MQLIPIRATDAAEKFAAEQEPRPGHLLAPFGWVAAPLLDMVMFDPVLLAAMLQLDRLRMHLIALSFAHLQSPLDPQLGHLLVRGSLTSVLDVVLGRRPSGLKRALDRLKFKVMSPEGYRRLVKLLEDPASAKLIYHAESLNEFWINLFFDIPGPLRRVVARASAEFFISMEDLTGGLHVLVSRGVAPTLDALVADLAQSRRPVELVAHINRLIEALPVPELAPPRNVQGARRIDEPSEIRSFAKRWKNCVWQYASATENVCASIYFWPDEHAPALCLVVCFGRLGWVLEDVKGPENSTLASERLEEVERAFASVGVPRGSAIRALRRVADAITDQQRNALVGRLREEDERHGVY